MGLPLLVFPLLFLQFLLLLLVLILLLVIVLVCFLTRPVRIVPNELVIFIELLGFGYGFGVVLSVEHIGRQTGLYVIVLQGRVCGIGCRFTLLTKHKYLLIRHHCLPIHPNRGSGTLSGCSGRHSS